MLGFLIHIWPQVPAKERGGMGVGGGGQVGQGQARPQRGMGLEAGPWGGEDRPQDRASAHVLT